MACVDRPSTEKYIQQTDQGTEQSRLSLDCIYVQADLMFVVLCASVVVTMLIYQSYMYTRK